MSSLQHLFARNRAWASRAKEADPTFFERLVHQQTPELLWIGCADSRVPANEIIDLPPGEVFVHRNIANVVVHTDLNCLSVIQYAVEMLRVKHIIVCGHYGCGGIQAALEDAEHGLIDNWLRHIKDVHRFHETALAGAPDPVARSDRLCELNVIEQVRNVAHTTIVRDAWRRGDDLTIHGWIYSIGDGILSELCRRDSA
jgi:carbonic anhydrase